MKNLSKNQKMYLAIYVGWAFLHLIFFALGWQGHRQYIFWPIGSDFYGNDDIEDAYDITEFLVYAGTPAVAFFIHRIIKNDE